MSPSLDEADEDPLVSCSFQNGTLSVYPTHLTIERASRSMYDDKRIEFSDIYGVEYSRGIMTGHLQIEQHGVESDSAGVFTHPVDENTLYFGWGGRNCATRARDVILERMEG